MHVFYLLQFARFDFVRIRQVLDELKVTLGGETEGKQNKGKENFLVVEKKKSKRMDDIYLSLLHVCFCLELSHCFRITCRNIFLTVELPL